MKKQVELLLRLLAACCGSFVQTGGVCVCADVSGLPVLSGPLTSCIHEAVTCRRVETPPLFSSFRLITGMSCAPPRARVTPAAPLQSQVPVGQDVAAFCSCWWCCREAGREHDLLLILGCFSFLWLHSAAGCSSGSIMHQFCCSKNTFLHRKHSGCDLTNTP